MCPPSTGAVRVLGGGAPAELLQPAVHVLQLLHLADLFRLQAYVLLLLAVGRLLADAYLPDQFGHRYHYLGLLQHSDYLLHG